MDFSIVQLLPSAQKTIYFMVKEQIRDPKELQVRETLGDSPLKITTFRFLQMFSAISRQNFPSLSTSPPFCLFCPFQSKTILHIEGFLKFFFYFGQFSFFFFIPRESSEQVETSILAAVGFFAVFIIHNEGQPECCQIY